MKDNVTKIMWHRVERQITDEDKYYYALQLQHMDRMGREVAEVPKMGQIINLRGKNDRGDNSDNL